MNYVIGALSAVLGSFGFAMVVRAPRRSWIPAAILGGIIYLLYSLLLIRFAPVLAMLIACSVAGLSAQLMSRHFRIINTVFMTIAIVPFVPGYSLYRSMALIGDGQNAEGLSAGSEAMIYILMIVLGLSLGDFLFRTLFRRTKR